MGFRYSQMIASRGPSKFEGSYGYSKHTMPLDQNNYYLNMMILGMPASWFYLIASRLALCKNNSLSSKTVVISEEIL